MIETSIIHGNTIIQFKLSKNCSIFTTEFIEILKAIEYIISCPIHETHMTILSAPLSALTSIQNISKPSDIAIKIHNALSAAQSSSTLPQIPHILFLFLYQALKAISLFYGLINGSIQIPNSMKLKLPFYPGPPHPTYYIDLCWLRIGHITLTIPHN